MEQCKQIGMRSLKEELSCYSLKLHRTACTPYVHSKNGYVMQNASLAFLVEVTQKFVILTVILM